MKYRSEPLPHSNENDWAHGCDKCRYGIVSAPELTGACSLYLERIVQMLDETLTFCTCKAGIRIYANLRNLRQAFIEEARRNPRMQQAAALGTHPDIDMARRAIQESYKMAPAPTVHAAEVA